MMSKYIIDFKNPIRSEKFSDPLSTTEVPGLGDECTQSEKRLSFETIEEPDCADYADLNLLYKEAQLYERLVKGLKAGGMSTTDAEELNARYEATAIDYNPPHSNIRLRTWLSSVGHLHHAYKLQEFKFL